jgi:hypothetical protein
MKSLMFIFVSSVLSLSYAAGSEADQVQAEVAKSPAVTVFVQQYRQAMEKFGLKATCAELQGTYDSGAGLFSGAVTCETVVGEDEKKQQKLSVQAAVNKIESDDEESGQKAQYNVMITQPQVVLAQE